MSSPACKREYKLSVGKIFLGANREDEMRSEERNGMGGTWKEVKRRVRGDAREKS
jgi:hypothetical protein